MKQSFCLVAFVVGFASIFFFSSCLRFNDINIEVSETKHTFGYHAKFPKDKSMEVARKLDQQIYPDQIFQESFYADKTVRLADGTVFLIEAEPGRLEIKADKEANSAQSLSRLKHLFNNLLNEKNSN